MIELKKFQKRVLEDLAFFLDRAITTSPAQAYHDVWQERCGIDISRPEFQMPSYAATKELPFTACIKVPTGGGKTFIGINAIQTILARVPADGIKAVVWLVPSDTILSQTLNSFRNALGHDYAKRLAQIGGNVAVYSKEELLNGVGFNRSTIQDQLTVMVLSYDSFRRANRADLRTMRENSNLEGFSLMESPSETVVNKLNPIVIVDESHHAKSELSRDMLKAFNPRFVLELTATPKKGSNIISCVNALELKREHMIKLPVILYNLKDHKDLLVTAISLRSRLESLARKHVVVDRPVRPIVLLQAQPRNQKDSVTFEKIKSKLMECQIPEEQIAIKTASVNQLEGVNLADPTCPIRYIITVNALKEGWDCPNAYILVSLANKTSKVDVEQIVGRVLRLPYASTHPAPALNLAYVLTSSMDFDATVQNVIAGLQNAGFSRKDCRAEDRAEEDKETSKPGPSQINLPLEDKSSQDKGEGEAETGGKASTDSDGSGTDPVDDLSKVDAKEVATRTKESEADEKGTDSGAENKQDKSIADAILRKGEKEESAYKENVQKNGQSTVGLTAEMSEKMRGYFIRDEFKAEISDMVLPVFGIEDDSGLLAFDPSENLQPLQHSHLLDGFCLANKDATINLSAGDADVVAIDGKESGEVTWKTPGQRQLELVQKLLTSEESVERKTKIAVDAVIKSCDRFDFVENRDLKRYVGNVMSGFNQWQIEQLIDNPALVITRLREKILGLADQHRRERFEMFLNAGRLEAFEAYHFPERVDAMGWMENAEKALYTGEEPGNELERELVRRLTGIESIRWWHRNPGKQWGGFCINGPLNAHYPDFIVRTNRGKIILIETKGAHLKGNDDTQYKQRIGQAWANMAGPNYLYFMVFADDSEMGNLTGVISMSQLIQTLSMMK